MKETHNGKYFRQDLLTEANSEGKGVRRNMLSPPRYLLIIKKRLVTSQLKPSSSRDKVSITVLRHLDITVPIRCTKKA